MRQPLVFMYSGQGAQYFHMGEELYQNHAVFKRWMDRASQILEPLIEVSLVEMIYHAGNKRFDPFDRTLYTHPANVAVAYALTRVLYHMGCFPDYLLGYSLGEYAAAIVAGGLSLEAGLEKVVRQAKMLEAQAPAAGMMAILEKPAIMEQQAALFQNCWLAGQNFAGHFVLTGRAEDLNRIEAALGQQNVTCQILPISHGFHSPLVDPIADECLALFDGFESFELPVVSCRLAKAVEHFDCGHPWSVIRGPIRFFETLNAFDASGPFDYVDLGPAGTLATFVKYGLGSGTQSRALTILNPFGKDLAMLDKLKAALA